MRRTTATKYSQQIHKKRFEEMTEEELAQRFIIMVVATVAILAAIGLSIVFLGPKIGGLFGFLSKNRNEDLTKDTVSPGTPIFLDYPTGTKEEKVTIKGFAESGSTVKLFANGPEKATTTADAEGSFTFSDVSIIKGRNVIFAKAVDSQGNESAASETITINYDNEAPKIEDVTPKKDEVIKNLDKRITVKGKVSEKATIKINDRMAIIKPDLTFELVLGVEEGTVKIKIEAVDEAGNKKEEEFSVRYQKSSI